MTVIGKNSRNLMPAVHNKVSRESCSVWGKIDPQASRCPKRSMRHSKKMRVVIGHAPPMTMREVMVPSGEQNGVETKFELFPRRGRSVKIGKESLDSTCKCNKGFMAFPGRWFEISWRIPGPGRKRPVRTSVFSPYCFQTT
jgi:hypothetical protein